LRVRGRVQGVGFRPFVYRLAHELGLDGWVRNDGGGVTIVLRASERALARFTRRLAEELPPLATLDAVEESAHLGSIAPGFIIVESEHGAVSTGIAPDAAICPACTKELVTPGDRRHRYPFINCTHCGPRFTITAELPYDRPSTSMAPFTMCPACQREYDDPLDRRFHAQPNACPQCGPRIWLADARGFPLAHDDVIAAAHARIACGEIVAIKGLGGFHLVCDARNAAAVQRLRERKHRDEKPFAIMAANVASLLPFAEVDTAAARALLAVERPIVLLPKRAGCDEALAGIAPGLAHVGAMLPYTPLQVLLFHQAAARPPGLGWLEEPQDLVLVMTSANPGGEPLVIDNHEAVARLGAEAGLADAFVMHDRAILVRCDDSVVRVDGATAGGAAPTFIRRARGYTPAAIKLAGAGPAVLALGGYLKTTACLTRGDEAFLSQHIGDLDNAPSRAALEEAAAHLQRVLEIAPQAIAHDLHPDFFSTELALGLARDLGVPAFGVQHHHAHIAAVAAEHRVEGPLLGIALDGVGHGDDGDAWGGELLAVAGAQFQRLGHFRPLPLPGGDRAAREPWRMAAAVLHQLGRDAEIADRFKTQPAAPVIRQMLRNDLRCPQTTSAGRWFDAAAGLLGVREVMAYEGQAAMLLEALAAQRPDVQPNAALYCITADGVLDLLRLAARLAEERDAATGAALFHATLALGLADWAAQAAQAQGLRTVALGGGCFLNAVLTDALTRHLSERGLTVLTARQAPPNDGGLALGQAWIARHLLNEVH
jgi:hydrogenase maturation protein HypF